jgi:outer membrane protein OmpA-like peptidoglycan-associated protein
MSPPPPDDPGSDRERILARRALFVTTAMAALGCSSQSTSNGAPTSATTETSAPAVTASATASTSAGVEPAKLRPWAEVEKNQPPLSVGPLVPADEKAELDALSAKLTPAYAALRKAWEAPPACSPKDCTAQWQDAAKAIHEARDAVDEPGPCGRWGRSVAIRQRSVEHMRHIATLTKELETALGDAAMKAGDATSWPKMVVLPPPPQVCLKCAPPQPSAVLDGGQWGSPIEVAFDAGVATLSKDAEEALAKVPRDAQGVIVVRGHADPTEPEPAKLAKARAEAARDWLVKNGVKANKLTVLSVASDLPLASSSTDEGKQRNRRVDFMFAEKK